MDQLLQLVDYLSMRSMYVCMYAAAAHVDRWTQAVRRLNAGLSVSDMVEEVLRRIYGNDLAQVSSLGFLTL